MHLLLVLIFLQIVSESFPVSSSGHVALALSYSARYLPMEYATIEPFFSNDILMFLLHIPTILILIIFFRSTWWPLLISFSRRWKLVLNLIGYALIADTITALLYIGMKIALPQMPLCLGFFITGMLLISLRWAPSDYKRLQLSGAAILGLVQGVALLPGISRLGSVYCASRWLGLSARKAFGVSWMLQFPLMVGAAGAASIKEIISPSIAWAGISLPLVCLATIVSYGALWLVDRVCQRNLIWLFGIYMIVPIMVCLLIPG